ncbi:MAG: HlyD family efflux transporter periplasmic adaptor subunit, partial [Planctomycetota bacterium]
SSKPVALQPKTKITGRQIVGTLVGTKELAVQVDLPESQLSNVANGMGCKITTKAVPDLEIHGKVRSVSRIGYALGKYDCVIDLLNPTAEQIVPTMACKVEFAKTKTHSESNQVTQEKE